jgi:hypothetical protein
MSKFYDFLVKALIIAFAVLGTISFIATITVLVFNGVLWGGPLNLERADQIGSFTGGFIGVFWSVLGVLLVFRTLQMQRIEFRETQTIVLDQQFEAAYFQMLGQLHSIKESIRKSEKDSGPTGITYLRSALEELKTRYDKELDEKKQSGKDYSETGNQWNKKSSVEENAEFVDYRGFVRVVFDNFYQQEHAVLGHYFRLLKSIVDFVVRSRSGNSLRHRNNRGDADKYLELLQAQMTNDELALMFYYGLSRKSSNLIEERELFEKLEANNFLENIEMKSLLDRSHHHFYRKTVFKFLNKDERFGKRKVESA